MQFKKVDFEEFCAHKNYYFEQIPKAQNSNPEYKQDVFDYYFNNLKNDNQNFIMTALENDEIIGCAFFMFYKEEGEFFLLNVNTKKEFQHSTKKVATNVLKFGLQEFFKTHDKIYLWVEKNNINAQKLYEKLNFATTDYYPDNLDFLANRQENEIIMELTKTVFEKDLKIENCNSNLTPISKKNLDQNNSLRK